MIPSNCLFTQALTATTGDNSYSNLHLSKCLVEPLVPKWFSITVLRNGFGRHSFTQSQRLDSLPLRETFAYQIVSIYCATKQGDAAKRK